jgi:hypothetical protein
MSRMAILLVALACACHDPAPAPTPPDPRLSTSLALVDDLSRLALGDGLEARERRRRAEALTAGTLAPEQLIDELLEDPRLGELAALLLFHDPYAGDPPFGTALQPRPLGELPGYHRGLGRPDEVVYTLRGPCAADSVERVSPWWEPRGTVLVCPDAHRPDVLVAEGGRYQCGARMLDPHRSPVCGCGPHLAQCARDTRHLAELYDSAKRELLDTVAYTINHDEPLARVFLRQDTVRELPTELLDRRWRLMAGTPVDLSDLPAWAAASAHRPAPRHEAFPGHHAGVLTTPYWQLHVDSPRTVASRTYEVLWCQETLSAGVTAEAMLGLEALDLRQGEGWQRLAAMPV